MKISYNWLKDYIDIKMPPAKLAETLTMAGLTVDSLERIGGDHILEIEVTANRPDWLSYIGVARELSALTGRRLKTPHVKKISKVGIPKESVSLCVEDKKLCPRYTGRVIHDVKTGESPAWLKSRLESTGLRPVNNIVDITNFCLFETGEPMHAFDLDKLNGRKLAIRRAKKNERIRTIDGQERVLDEDMLVIADENRPVAIAGIMGGIDTEVTGSTKNILLEAACFDPISVRRTSRKLGLASESSYRFERKVDTVNIANASDRASQLIIGIAGGAAGAFFDIGPRKETGDKITLRAAMVKSILGADIAAAKIKNILMKLGLRIESATKNVFKISSPGFRHDIKSEIDIIEEISRVYGYDKIPETLPPITGQSMGASKEAATEDSIRSILTALGLDEIITYSLLSRGVAGMISPENKGIVEIKNPLSGEQEVMRPGLAAGMLQAVAWNINRRSKNLKFFEIGNIYLKENDNFIEKKRISMGITGEVSSWATGSRKFGFFDLKGIAESLLGELGIGKISFKYSDNRVFKPSASAVIIIGSEEAGIIGELNEKILGDFDIKESVYYCEIDLKPVFAHASFEKRFLELPKYPSVYRDISIVVAKNVPNADVMAAIYENGGPVLKEAALIDRYCGKQVPDGKVSLTYRLEYQSSAKTLEEKEVSELHSRILAALGEKFGATLRQ